MQTNALFKLGMTFHNKIDFIMYLEIKKRLKRPTSLTNIEKSN